MPLSHGPLASGSGGGGGLYFRNPPDEFTGANVAACRTARNTYFSNTSNSTDLGEFQGDQALAIILNPTSGDTVYETYLPGDDVGDTYDATKWIERTDAIVGRSGESGPQSRIVLYAYINTATAPTVAPTGGTFVQSTGVKTVPTGYTVAPVSPPTGQETYQAEAIVNPAVDANTVNLVWSIPALLPAYASATLAEGFADDAAASATAAAGSAALVDSYDGAVAILDAVPFESNNSDLTVLGWREYDFLQFVPRDSDATTQFSRPAALIPTTDLDTVGGSRVPINNNDELRVDRTATSDVISINITGWSGHPTTGDVITVYGIRSGVEAGGGGGGGGGLDTSQVQALIDATSLSALQGQVTDTQIPAAIMRDAELTAAAVRTLLGLTATEVNDLFTGGSITGQVITFTQNDGTTETITVPAGTSGMADGVLDGGTFNADGTELNLTIDTDGTSSTVTISVPALLRGGAGVALSAEDEGSEIDGNVSILNFVGEGVTVTQTASGEVQVSIPGSGAPSTHTSQYLALKGTADPTAADFEGANGQAFDDGSHTAMAPSTPAGNVYLLLWRISTDPEPVFLDVNNSGFNQFGAVTKQAATIDLTNGDTGEVWVSENALAYQAASVEFR